MKKILLITLAFSLFACTNRGPYNKYLGRIPAIECEEQDEYSKFVPEGKSWLDSGHLKYAKLISDEMEKLKGVCFPCVSGQPDLFSVVGDMAFFHGTSYRMMIRFNKTVSIYKDSWIYVDFCNTEDKQHYGGKKQILFLRSFLEDGWHYVKVSGYNKGDLLTQEIYLNTIDTQSPFKLQEKTDIAVVYLEERDYETLQDSKTANKYVFPENWAFYYQDGFYNAIINNNLEEYDGLDYQYGEMDGFDKNEWVHFGQAYDLWKQIYPDKWKVIKEYRKGQIDKGYALVTLDMDDPE